LSSDPPIITSKLISGSTPQHVLERKDGKTGSRRALRARAGSRRGRRGRPVVQEPVLGAANRERRNCPGVRGVLSEVPEASMSAPAAMRAFNTSGWRPIIPANRREPFDDPAWLFDLKLDGFRGMADTIAGRMLSKNGNRMKRYEQLLEVLPAGYVFDGEIVALDEGGRPVFNDLMFGRRAPVYVAFDVLFADGEDVRGAPLKE